MGSRATSLAWLLMIGLLATPACKRNRARHGDQPPRAAAADPGGRSIAVGEVRVTITADRTLESPALERSTVLARVRERLTRAPRVVLLAPDRPTGGSDPTPPPYTLTLELALARSAPGQGLDGPVAVVAAEGRVPGALDAPRLQAQAVGPLLERANRARVKQNLLRLLDTVLDDLVFQAGLVTAPVEDVVRSLKQTRDVQRLSAAIEICSVRRLKQAVVPLIGMLSHKNQEVVDRAAGALIEIGDRRAVRPLTRLSKLQDTARLAKLLDGIATLGGSEAASFLEFVASGHEDEDIRFMAAEALERMKRRQGAGVAPK